MSDTNQEIDAFELRKLYEPLRVVDVCDALDGIGYFDIGLMSEQVRPLWAGMKFWGVALTIRCVPANRPMWKLQTTDEIVRAHGIWFKQVPTVRYRDLIRPGHVLVMDSGGAGEVGYWGSANSMGAMTAGAVGIVTDGYCRDTDEVILQKTPICARARGRTIIPGRIQTVGVQEPIGCGGVQVRPNDIVGCDGDGIVVVPLEVAKVVADHARAVLLADMHSRAKLYEKLGLPKDATVDYAAVESYYAGLGGNDE